MTPYVDALKEALDTWAIELPDMPGQVLVNGEKWPTIFNAARGYLRLLTEGREILWCETHGSGEERINEFTERSCCATIHPAGTIQPCHIEARLLIERDQ